MSHNLRIMSHSYQQRVGFAIARTLSFSVALLFVFLARDASASIVGMAEQQNWSDLTISGTTGGFNSGTGILSLSSVMQLGDLEIGGQWGPLSSIGRNYGPSGTLGGPFYATMTLANVAINPLGPLNQVTTGSLLITYSGGATGSVGTDYNIANGAPLLIGSVTQVVLNAAGDNSLDIVLAFTGGALQQVNSTLGTNFAPGNLGLLRLRNNGLPDDWRDIFTLAGTTTVDVYGIVPEPRFATFMMFGLILAWVSGSRGLFSLA
jgi:hypothetical protein